MRAGGADEIKPVSAFAALPKPHRPTPADLVAAHGKWTVPDILAPGLTSSSSASTPASIPAPLTAPGYRGSNSASEVLPCISSVRTSWLRTASVRELSGPR